jgi:hypothetical protein
MVYFDINKPTSNNIICENRDKNRAAIFKDGGWYTTELYKLAEELVYSQGKNMQNIYDKYKLSFTDKKKEEITRFINKINAPPIIDTQLSPEEAIYNFNKQQAYKKRLTEEMVNTLYDGTKNLRLKRTSSKI